MSHRHSTCETGLGGVLRDDDSPSFALLLIVCIAGRPSEDDVRSVRSPYAATMLDGLPGVRTRHMASVFPAASAEALDFISRCLVFNPSRRMTVEQALKHAYVSQFHSPADEPRCPRVIAIQIDDNIKYTAADYRDRLYREIARKKKEARARRAARAARSGAGGAALASGTGSSSGRGGDAAGASSGSARGSGRAGAAAASAASGSH